MAAHTLRSLGRTDGDRRGAPGWDAAGSPTRHLPVARYAPVVLFAASFSLIVGCSSESSAPDAARDTHPDTPAERCARIRASIAEAGFADVVSVSCDGTRAIVTADTYPAHEKMNGIVATNEQVPVPAPGYAAPVPLAPRLTGGWVTRDAALGVAVNGVPIYDYTSQGELDPTAPYDPAADVVATGQLDVCGGHAGRGDDYHYHAAPTCLAASMKNRGPGAILGWAHDGFPIYGDAAPDGTKLDPGALDVCNGMPDPVVGWRYHTSPTPPYILQCWRGEVDTEALPRVPPLRAPGGGGKPPGMPPKGGVQDLSFTEEADGRRTMTYRHQGKDYFVRYQPSGKPGCFAFEMNTVSGGTSSGEFCRE